MGSYHFSDFWSFNPRLPGRRRPHRSARRSNDDRRFNPRLPGRRRRAHRNITLCGAFSFNPRLPGRRRPQITFAIDDADSFNPRLPGRRRRVFETEDNKGIEFQSTPSGEKATQRPRWHPQRDGVSIHAFRGEGDVRAGGALNGLRSFNPRLPGGRRQRSQIERYQCIVFQSTPSGGKATPADKIDVRDVIRFNPRLPGGRRRNALVGIRNVMAFQSTPSGGKATAGGRGAQRFAEFQSTPSGGKATSAISVLGGFYECFNPRLPGGRRHAARHL